MLNDPKVHFLPAPDVVLPMNKRTLEILTFSLGQALDTVANQNPTFRAAILDALSAEESLLKKEPYHEGSPTGVAINALSEIRRSLQ